MVYSSYMPHTNVTITQRRKVLPSSPGVYRFFDVNNKLLYVGKAKDLRKRVQSYFRTAANLALDKQIMVKKIADIQWTIVDNELEALFLEATLIKNHRPPFNIALRDDKDFAYIKVTTGETYPKVFPTRELANDPPRNGTGRRTRYFGPYTSMHSLSETLTTIKDIFTGRARRSRVRSTKIPDDMVCFLHRKPCSGFCKGLVDKTEYAETIVKIIGFLEGKYAEVEREIESRMVVAAESRNFEQAARLRDQLFAVRRMTARQKVIAPLGESFDLLALARVSHVACVALFPVRGGKLMTARQFLLKNADDQDDATALAAFAEQYYLLTTDVPDTIVTRETITISHALLQFLSSKLPHGKKCRLQIAQRGKKKQLLDLAGRNAADYAGQQLATWQLPANDLNGGVNALQKALGLSKIKRIECFDISNTQGTNPVGSMVVCDNGKMKKADYRRFHIRGKRTPDDPHMMAEMLLRRLTHDEWPAADLIILDGGKSQISVVTTELEKQYGPGTTSIPPIVGLAKREEILFRIKQDPRRDNLRVVPTKSADVVFEEIRLPKDSAGYFLIQRIRDEAHRFAITFHRKTRDKAMLA